MSATRKGRSNYWLKGKQSPDLIAKRVASRAGYKHSLEVIEKIRNSQPEKNSRRKD